MVGRELVAVNRAIPPARGFAANQDILERIAASTATAPRARVICCPGCGSGYVVVRRDKRGLVVGCSRVRETGLCDNGYTLGLEALETWVIESIDEHLAAPELIYEYVREFHARWRELRDTEERRRRAIERELATIERELKRAVDAFIELRTRPLRDRVCALEADRERLEADLAAVPAPPIELHPNASEHYRRQVAELKKTLASLSPERRAEAFAGVRKLVEKIVIHPTGPYKPADLEIRGRLAALLRVSKEAAAADYESVSVVVAGVGFEPTTFRL
jgi:site-specific DNA recombinase